MASFDGEDKGKGPFDEATSTGPDTTRGPYESSTPAPDKGPKAQPPASPPAPPPPPPPPFSDESKLDVPDESSSDPPKAARPRSPPPKLESRPSFDPHTQLRERDYRDPDPVPLWDPSEFYRWSYWRAGIAEFFATFLLLYFGLLIAVGSNADGSCSRPGTLGIAFGFGMTVFILVYSIAGVSGGHINPAITFAMLIVRRISIPRALLYAILQVLGALAGAGLVKATQKGYYQRYGGGANFVHNGYSKGAGFVAEMVGTFLVLYVVFAATDPKRKARDAHIPILAPFAIGMAVFVVHLATIPITGTGLNPARSFAAASLWDHHDHAWHDHWIYWVAPLLGAFEAAIYYQYIIRAIPFRNLDLSNILTGPGRPRPEI